MPSDTDKEAYPSPPRQTPVTNRDIPLTVIGSTIFHYLVDLPVTTLRGVMDSLQSKERPVYYHKKFRRVPYLTECETGDLVCSFEAELQFKRDYKVDQQILLIVQERLSACQKREGDSHEQNCLNELKLFEDTVRAYNSRYGDLGAYATSIRCLMKQKQRMHNAQVGSA